MAFCRTSLLLTTLVLLAACGPTEPQKATEAERRRIECLDKFCPGDVEPKRDVRTEVAIKLNGQWFIGPADYFSTGMNGAAFFWPSKMSARPTASDFLEKVFATSGRADEVTIEVFLRSRNSQPQGPSRYQALLNAEVEGRVLSKHLLRPGLELWQTRETDGLGQGLWYVATQYAATDPNGSVLSCRRRDPQYDRCVTAFEWKPGVTADMRFRAKHAPDWPEIYQEAIRVLQLLRKA